MRKHFKNIFFRLFLVPVFLCACESCPTGDWKCKNNVLYHCLKPNNATTSSSKGLNSVWEAVIDCGEYGAVCEKNTKGYAPFVAMNSYLEENSDNACVVSEFECEEGFNTACFNDVIVECDNGQGKVVIKDTMDYNAGGSKMVGYGIYYETCVEDYDSYEAYFAYNDESCTDGEEYCYNERAFLTCNHGYWTNGTVCEDYTKNCVEDGAGQASCSE